MCCSTRESSPPTALVECGGLCSNKPLYVHTEYVIVLRTPLTILIRLESVQPSSSPPSLLVPRVACSRLFCSFAKLRRQTWETQLDDYAYGQLNIHLTQGLFSRTSVKELRWAADIGQANQRLLFTAAALFSMTKLAVALMNTRSV